MLERKQKKTIESVPHTNKLVCVYIYILIYSGYLKILFPVISKGLVLLQYFVTAISLLAVLRWGVIKKQVLVSAVSLKPIWSVTVSFSVFSLLYFKSDNIANAQGKILSMLVTIAFMFIVFLIVMPLADDASVRYLIDLIISLNLIFLVLYIVINITHILVLVGQGLRGSDMNQNPIWIARMSGDTIVLLLVRKQKKISFELILKLIFLSLIEFLMGSKGPLVATLVAVFIYYLKSRNNGKKIGIIFIAGITLFLLYEVILNSASSYIQNRFSLESIFVSSPGYRVSRYIYTIQHIPEKILTGHGLGSWSVNYWDGMNYIPVWVTNEMRRLDYPHNLFLEVLYEGGVLVFIPLIRGLLFVHGIPSRIGIKITNTYRGIQILYLTNMIYAMFSGSVTEGNRGVYYMLALLCGLYSANYMKHKHEM